MEKQPNAIMYSEEEKSTLDGIDAKIASLQEERAAYIRQIRESRDIVRSRLCILTYNQPVATNKHTRGLWDPIKYENKEVIRLAFISWKETSKGFRPQFNEVSSKNQRGNEILSSLYRDPDFSYELLDETTTPDEARLILKERKKKPKQ